MKAQKGARPLPSRKIGARGGLSRRRFMENAGLGVGGVLLAGRSSSAWAAPTDTIRVGFISPKTGALAGFGEADPHALKLVRKALAGGLTAGGKTYDVTISDHDTQSDPVRAGQIAKHLIDSNEIDFMLTTATPETTNPVSDACEAAGVPCIATGTPWESWYFGRGAKPGQPSPFHWSYCFGFGMKDFATAYVAQWNGPVKTNRKVATLWPNDADGNALRHGLNPILTNANFTVVDPGGYEDGTTDYSTQIAKFKAANCEIFTTGPIPPDFATFWRQAAAQGYTRMVKIAQIAKTGLFPSQVEALGSLGPRLASVAFWHPTFPYPSPVLHESSQQLADGYQNATGRQWNQAFGNTIALFDAGVSALKDCPAPKNKAALAKTLSTLKVTTLVGHLDWTKGPVPNCVPMVLIGAQWVKAKPGSHFKLDLVITDNADDRNVPIGAKLVPYNEA
jgi:branched-chain amino acid transport system substrate-binding protein